MNLGRRLLDAAASLAPAMLLRSLDAIHLASALLIGDLRAVVPYYGRMTDAATAIGLVVEMPA